MKSENKFKSYERFAEIITAKSITSYRVAVDTGISPMTLSDWKNGKSKPKLDKMLKIASYLKCDVSEFADEEGQ